MKAPDLFMFKGPGSSDYVRWGPLATPLLSRLSLSRLSQGWLACLAGSEWTGEATPPIPSQLEPEPWMLAPLAVKIPLVV